MNGFSFDERLRWSDGYASSSEIGLILREHIPGCVSVERADTTADRNGTDWWCIRTAPLRRLSVDAKVRSLDPIEQFGMDDLALETWSVIDKKVGWTRDPSKHSDFILWLFTTTNRFVLIPFPMLCHVFSRKWREWSAAYRTEQQNSGTWQSECVFVPRREMWAELYRVYGGGQSMGATVGGRKVLIGRTP